MKTTTVTGISMFAFNREPGAARCDDCGKVEQFGRYNALKRLPELEKEGWNFSSHTIGASAICPDCSHNK